MKTLVLAIAQIEKKYNIIFSIKINYLSILAKQNKLRLRFVK